VGKGLLIGPKCRLDRGVASRADGGLGSEATFLYGTLTESQVAEGNVGYRQYEQPPT